MTSSPNFTRRNFLKTSGGLLLTGGSIACGHSALSSKKSVSWTLACRDAHLKETQASSSWEAMKQIGVTGVEVQVKEDMTCPNLYHPQKKYAVDKDNIKTLKKDLAEQGLEITAFMMANRFDERPDEELAWTKRVVNASKRLNVPAIRIDVVPRAIERENFLPFAIKMCKQICELTEGTPVRYGIENHGNTTNDPVFLTKLFDGVGSSHLGLTLDTANFYWYGHPLDDLYGIFEKFAPRAFHTHCKSIKYPNDKKNVKRKMGWEYGKYCCPIHQGDIDFNKVAAILRAANYTGDLCIENESLGKFPEAQRGEILKKEAALLRSLV